jgi:hypothetical protein
MWSGVTRERTPERKICSDYGRDTPFDGKHLDKPPGQMPNMFGIALRLQRLHCNVKLFDNLRARLPCGNPDRSLFGHKIAWLKVRVRESFARAVGGEGDAFGLKNEAGNAGSGLSPDTGRSGEFKDNVATKNPFISELSSATLRPLQQSHR